MTVVALVCSARRRGNYYSLAQIMLNNLKKKSIETEILNAYNYEITPCSHCNYECFESPRNCPIRDDVPEIWEKLKEADSCIFAIPTYYGVPSALYRAIIEREQGILELVGSIPEFRDLEGVWKDKIVAIFVVSNGGGENVKNIILEYFPSQTKTMAEVFSCCKYGTAGYNSSLAKNKDVVSRAKRLTHNVYQFLKPKKG